MNERTRGPNIARGCPKKKRHLLSIKQNEKSTRMILNKIIWFSSFQLCTATAPNLITHSQIAPGLKRNAKDQRLVITGVDPSNINAKRTHPLRIPSAQGAPFPDMGRPHSLVRGHRSGTRRDGRIGEGDAPGHGGSRASGDGSRVLGFRRTRGGGVRTARGAGRICGVCLCFF